MVAVRTIVLEVPTGMFRFGSLADIEARSLRVRLTLPKAGIDGLRGPLTERFILVAFQVL
jgi:hypothetical protein